MKNLNFLILFISFSLFAQLPSNSNIATGTLIGKVIEASSKQPLPYVNIIIKSINNKVITGGITNAEGNFNIKKIPEGEVLVEIQYIGYQTEKQKVTFSRGNNRINLGTISLKETSNELKEVVVVAETSTVTQKVDRKVINVGKDLTAAGATASELLNNVQSVSVDSQTGAVSLRGNENVRILVDGKPTNISAAQLLKQIPSTSIKSVELITNPSAKYNPEGMSGIINIVLHKNANLGFNASVNSGITIGKNTRYNGSLDMNFKTGKINIFSNYGINAGKSENNGFVNRTDNQSLQEFFMTNNRTSHLLKLGFDWYINDKNTFSAYTNQNFSNNNRNNTSLVSFNNVIDSNSPLLSEVDGKAHTYDFNYKLDFNKKGHSLEFEANYSEANYPEDATYNELINPSDLTRNYIEKVKNDRKTALYNLDYTNPVSKNAKLELGLEVRLTDTNNNNISTQYDYQYDANGNLIPDGNGGFVTIPRGNSSFSYNRDIYSGYFNFNQKFDKFSLQVGTRFEQYRVTGNFARNTQTATYKDDIFTAYPSAFLTFNPNEKNQFQVSYSRRVDRPSVSQVNPIREWSTPQITSVGNPDLRPQFTNSYELNYTHQYKKGSFTFGTFYRRVNDNITRILNIDPLDEDKVELSFSNTKSNDRYGIEISNNHKIANWWRVNSSFDFYTQKESGIANGQQLEITNTALNFRLNNSFKASKNLRFQLFAMYRGGGRSIQFNVDPMWMINAGTRLNILKGKGTISFRVNDIFKGMKFKFDSQNPYPQFGEFHWESQTAYFGFNYRFGQGKNRARARKNRDSNTKQNGGGFI